MELKNFIYHSEFIRGHVRHEFNHSYTFFLTPNGKTSGDVWWRTKARYDNIPKVGKSHHLIIWELLMSFSCHSAFIVLGPNWPFEAFKIERCKYTSQFAFDCIKILLHGTKSLKNAVSFHTQQVCIILKLQYRSYCTIAIQCTMLLDGNFLHLTNQLIMVTLGKPLYNGDCL